jgi:hypothetical protein
VREVSQASSRDRNAALFLPSCRARSMPEQSSQQELLSMTEIINIMFLMAVEKAFLERKVKIDSAAIQFLNPLWLETFK